MEQEMTRRIDLIIIHCADTPNGRTLYTGKAGDKNFVTPVQEIDGWHRARGFKRMPQWRAKQNQNLTSIGYHFVIYTRGAVATARHVDEIGAHVQGYNATSLGICLIGRDQFSIEQWNALKSLVEGLQKQYPQARVVGHYSLSKAKTCPNFDVAEWLQAGRLPLANRLYNPEPGAIA
jgi:N-acetylmuramoyl-L-alanine amidase